MRIPPISVCYEVSRLKRSRGREENVKMNRYGLEDETEDVTTDTLEGKRPVPLWSKKGFKTPPVLVITYTDSMKSQRGRRMRHQWEKGIEGVTCKRCGFKTSYRWMRRGAGPCSGIPMGQRYITLCGELPYKGQICRHQYGMTCETLKHSKVKCCRLCPINCNSRCQNEGEPKRKVNGRALRKSIIRSKRGSQ